MGHSRLGGLPRTRKWMEVVGLIEHGASAAQVANATLRAAEAGFLKAANDLGVTGSVWMLMQLPLAARSKDWVASLQNLGIDVKQAPTLMELQAKVTAAIDAKLANSGRRSDLGELAQNALAETLCNALGDRLPTLFSPNPADVQGAIADCHTEKNFGSLARDFFSRVTNHYLNYFLTKTYGNHVGEGRRFATLSQVASFKDALKTHCYEDAKIVERFSAEWRSKTNHEQKGIPWKEASDFTYGAMAKLVSELKEGARDHGEQSGHSVRQRGYAGSPLGRQKTNQVRDVGAELEHPSRVAQDP